jgi:hypothetical protein
MGAGRVLVGAVAMAAIVAAASRPSAAAPRPIARFLLTSFVQRGRTDIRRNEVLEFRFSAPLRRGSVDDRTLQVVELIPEGRRPVVGARIVQGNVVRLDPRRTQRNYDAAQLPDSTVTERDHEIGFSASARFEVQIRDGASKRVLRARDGRRIARRYDGSFATNTLYDDPVPGQPNFVPAGGWYPYEFSPPRSGATSLVDADAVILFRFSEPIAPESMRLGETVIVRYLQSDATLPGTLAPWGAGQSLDLWVFAPTGGFDSNFSLSVGITTGITDLAGNPLQRAVPTASYAIRSAE